MPLIENCGVVAALNFKGEDVVSKLYWGLIALNHRGQQSYGILCFNGEFKSYKGLGLISHLDFEELGVLVSKLKGSLGIGHVRYATSGGITRNTLLRDVQPHVVGEEKSKIAIAYNGNIVNVNALRRELVSRGVRFYGTSDSEVLAYELLRAYEDVGELVESVREVMKRVDGAYSVVGVTSKGVLFTFRDPYGIRPLTIGLRGREVFMAASESVALDINEVPFMRNVSPGELILTVDSNIEYYKLTSSSTENLCAFEYAYFSRPDSKLQNGKYVYQVRRSLGRCLARRSRDLTSRIDIVVPVPQTAIDAAYGFHEETGKPIEPVIVRSRYVSQRAFIMTSESRGEIIRRKYNVLRDRIWGKRVALIDDSIVRGDTLKYIVKSLKSAGAREVHVFSTFPKIISPCFYGIDMSTYCELVGFNRDEEEIASLISADSVTYQRISDFYYSVGCKSLCLGCVTGKYPTPKAQYYAKKGLEEECEGRPPKGRLLEVLVE